MAKTRDSLGHRIQVRRKQAGHSLRDLAAKTDLTASFISQVERDQTNPSIDSLRRIAEALQVSILYFLSDHTQPQPKSRPPKNKSLAYVPVVRANTRAQLTLPVSGVTYELLTPGLAHKMEAVCGRLAPGTGNVARRLREPTEEFIYVLSGSLCIGLDAGEQILHAGDSIYFSGTTLQKLACASQEDAVWISVITPPVF
jgi:transcriptional regulator with XRE-family HTH domain/quercetin dioxygenase-like cupin family protein